MFGINQDQVVAIASYVTLFGLGYAVIDCINQSRKIKKEKSLMLSWKNVYTLQDQKKVNLNDMKKEGAAMTYMEVEQSRSTITPITINRRIQAFPKQLLGSLQLGGILQRQCGNNFEYQFNRDKIKMNIRQCNISVDALDRKVTPILLHPKSVPSHYDIFYTLKAVIPLSFIGMLTYNLQAKQFEFEPFFMLPKVQMEETIRWLNLYYDERLISIRIWKILLGISFGCLSFLIAFNIRNDCNKLWNYIKSKFGIERPNRLQYIQTRSSDRLKCMCGKAMNIIGNCGHLSMCSQCFSKHKSCKICNKVITKETIIYI